MKINKPVMMDASQLECAPWNYKLDELEKLEKFCNSVKKNGFLYGLMAAQKLESPEDETWEVVDGNHRLKVLKDIMKVEKIPVYQLGRLSLEERMRISIEMNLWHFEPDKVKLSECFSNLSVFGLEDLEKTMPFTSEQINSIISIKDLNFDDYYNENEGKKLEKTYKVTFTQQQIMLIRKLESLVKKENNGKSDVSDIIVYLCKEYLTSL